MYSNFFKDDVLYFVLRLVQFWYYLCKFIKTTETFHIVLTSLLLETSAEKTQNFS